MKYWMVDERKKDLWQISNTCGASLICNAMYVSSDACTVHTHTHTYVALVFAPMGAVEYGLVSKRGVVMGHLSTPSSLCSRGVVRLQPAPPMPLPQLIKRD